jgi:hypothetical protein
MRQRLSLTSLHERGGEEASAALPKAESLNLYGEARRGDPPWLKRESAWELAQCTLRSLNSEARMISSNKILAH